jgi:hypothetical protein
MSESRGKRVDIVAYADSLKDILCDVFGIKSEYLHGNDDDKNNFTDFDWDRIPGSIRGEAFGFRGGKMRVREVMQFFGTEIMRKMFDNEVWIKCVVRKIDKSNANVFIIPDVRFENEVMAVKDRGGIVIRVIGPHRCKVKEKDSHSTETSLDSFSGVDYTISNEWGTTLGQLESQLEKIL